MEGSTYHHLSQKIPFSQNEFSSFENFRSCFEKSRFGALIKKWQLVYTACVLGPCSKLSTFFPQGCDSKSRFQSIYTSVGTCKYNFRDKLCPYVHKYERTYVRTQARTHARTYVKSNQIKRPLRHVIYQVKIFRQSP